jgi:hypothetical protein
MTARLRERGKGKKAVVCAAGEHAAVGAAALARSRFVRRLALPRPMQCDLCGENGCHFGVHGCNNEIPEYLQDGFRTWSRFERPALTSAGPPTSAEMVTVAAQQLSDKGHAPAGKRFIENRA